MNTTDYDRIEAAIRYLARHRKRQPELAELAAHIGLSQSHLHRLFSHWAGVTPKRFLDSLPFSTRSSYSTAPSPCSRRPMVRALRPGQAARSLRNRGSRHAGRVPEQRRGADDPLRHRRITVRACVRRLDRARRLPGWVCSRRGHLRREGGSSPGLGAGVARRRRIDGNSTGAVHLLGTLRSREPPADRPCAWDQLPTGRLARPAARTSRAGRHLRSPSRRGLQRTGGSGDGERGGQKPDRLPHPVPSRDPSGGDHGQLRRGVTRKRCMLAWEASRQFTASPTRQP